MSRFPCQYFGQAYQYRTHFPASTNNIVDGGDLEMKYAKSVRAVMDWFAEIEVTEELEWTRLENVMILDTGVHELFDSLNISLEETDTPHMPYRLSSKAGFIKSLSPTVTFTTTTDLPLPDHRYLRVHAGCAKVANMSGAGEFANRILRDMEDICILVAVFEPHEHGQRKRC